MMKIILSVLLLFPACLSAQDLSVYVFGGFSNYQGDLQGKPFTLDQSNAAFGAGFTYALPRRFFVRTGFTAGKVQASDRFNKASLQVRNLSFYSGITEGSLVAGYDLFSMEDRRFSPYVFAGIALFHFNPHTYDSTGTRIALQPLGTEGQGLAQYPAREVYKLTQFSLPFGGGLKWRLTDNVMIAYELGLRKLSTDYLDDVSAAYADGNTLAAAKGAKAVELAYRGDEVKNGNPVYPPAGTVRGNPKLKDWYYFHGLTLSIAIHSPGGRRSRYGCPVRVL